jgi:hypothetical protein
MVLNVESIILFDEEEEEENQRTPLPSLPQKTPTRPHLNLLLSFSRLPCPMSPS